MTAQTPIEAATPAEIQAATGRGYLRGAVTLLEHAAVLLAHVPDEELVPVDGLAERCGIALDYLQRHEAPPVPEIPRDEPPAEVPLLETARPAGGLW